MKSIISINDLYYAYPNEEVLQGVDLQVRQGEVVCLMGANGCGKTTLLDNILRVHKPKSGTIRLCDKDISEYKRKDIAQRIAYIPQIHNTTFPYLVREIVAMGRTCHAHVMGRPSEEDLEISLDSLRQVGMLEYAEKSYTQLSGGEVKLVMLARALAQKASIILMDEPTAHLDMRNELLFLQVTKELVRKEKISVILATHDPEHAFYFEGCGVPTRAVMLKYGKIMAIGKPSEILNEETIAKTYAVQVRIMESKDGNHRVNKSIYLQHTLKEDSSEKEL